MFGPVGTFFASFVSGMVSSWGTNTPPSLNTTFASLLIRLQNTSLAVDAQLAVYYQNVAANWNVQFTDNGQTQTLSNLANITVPAEHDPQFEALAKAAIFALDQQIWQTVMLANYVVTYFELNGGDYIYPGEQNQPPVSYDESDIAAHPADYNTWYWHDSSGAATTAVGTYS